MDAARIPFDPMDEQRIASAATWGLITAITSLVSAFITTAVTVPAFLKLTDNPLLGTMALAPLGLTLLGLVITMLLDVWLIQASLAFRKVAVTDEADQHYLLAGFSKLRNYFMVLGIMCILATLAVVAGFFLAMSA